MVVGSAFGPWRLVHSRVPPTSDQAVPVDIRSVSLISLGCPKNLVDSEKMLGLLAEAGVAPVAASSSSSDAGHDDSGNTDLGAGGAPPPEIDEADAVVINTCGFLEASKEESLATIRAAIDAKRQGRVKRVVVAGCLVQRHRAALDAWAPGIDAMLGVFDRDKVLEAVRGDGAARETLADAGGVAPRYWVAANALTAARERGRNTVGLTVNGKDGKGIGYFESDSARLRLTPRHYAYLRISEGCNQACAFCTIPSIRGKMRSKPIDVIADEARELVRDGALELSLIGQDTTSYGDDIGQGWGELDSAGGLFDRGGLPAMLRAVCGAMEAEGVEGWVRLMYAYPSNFRDEFIEAFAELCATSRLVPYIDIPLQHASDRMLTAMRRHVAASQQAELMHKLRERVPGIAIRTTFISGFPGESEADHEALLAFVEEVGFDAVGVFEYSPEPGTPAGTMEADAALAVPGEVKRRRKGEIMELQQRLAFEQAAYLAEQFDPEHPTDSGVRLDLLIDGQAEGGSSRARAYFQAPQIDAVTYLVSERARAPGEIVPAVVVGSEGYDLIARPVDELA